MGIEVFGPQPRPARTRTPRPPGSRRGPRAPREPRGGLRANGSGLGVLALVLALGFAAVHTVAILTAADGDFALASQLAVVAIVGTVITLVLGVIVVVIGAGRRWGVAAALLSVLANPFALRHILDFFGTLTTSQ